MLHVWEEERHICRFSVEPEGSGPLGWSSLRFFLSLFILSVYSSL